jgi:hypothetical protein
MASRHGHLVKPFSATKGSPSEGRVCYQTRVRMLRSRRLLHALIDAVVFLAVAGLYRLEDADRGARILKNWEYGFRNNMLTVGGEGTIHPTAGWSSWAAKRIPLGDGRRHLLPARLDR